MKISKYSLLFIALISFSNCFAMQLPRTSMTGLGPEIYMANIGIRSYQQTRNNQIQQLINNRGISQAEATELYNAELARLEKRRDDLIALEESARRKEREQRRFMEWALEDW